MYVTLDKENDTTAVEDLVEERGSLLILLLPLVLLLLSLDL